MVLDWFVIGGVVAATAAAGVTGAALGYYLSRKRVYIYPYFWHYPFPAYRYYYGPVWVPSYSLIYR
ncbi:MAG: hypothetical protein QXG01_07245 [Candidatus Bathyarchaeia archaeon]